MINDILLKLLPQFNKLPKDYIEAISVKYDNFIKISEIPVICYNFYDKSIIPNELINLYNQINIAVKDRYSFLIGVSNFTNIDYIVYMLLNNYFKLCIDNNELLETILYIDTNLLLDDYKRLIDYKNDELSLKPTHSLDTLYVNLEKVPLVIWNKFNMITSNFDRNKIYNIITARQRKGLCNIYIIDVPAKQLQNYIGDELTQLISNEISLGIDCTKGMRTAKGAK